MSLRNDRGRRLIPRPAFLTPFEAVVAGGLLVCLCLAVITSLGRDHSHLNLGAVISYPSGSK